MERCDTAPNVSRFGPGRCFNDRCRSFFVHACNVSNMSTVSSMDFTWSTGTPNSNMIENTNPRKARIDRSLRPCVVGAMSSPSDVHLPNPSSTMNLCSRVVMRGSCDSSLPSDSDDTKSSGNFFRCTPMRRPFPMTRMSQPYCSGFEESLPRALILAGSVGETSIRTSSSSTPRRLSGMPSRTRAVVRRCPTACPRPSPARSCPAVPGP